MYGSFSERSPRWDPEEFASKEENLLLNKQRETFKAEIEKAEKAAKDQTVELSAALDNLRRFDFARNLVWVGVDANLLRERRTVSVVAARDRLDPTPPGRTVPIGRLGLR